MATWTTFRKVEMLHEIELQYDLKVWHPSLTIRDMEVQLGLSASSGHDVGQKRVHGDRGKAHSTFAIFPLVSRQLINTRTAEELTLGKISPKKDVLSEMVKSGGEALLRVRLFDGDFISLWFSGLMINFLGEIKASLFVEDYSP